LHLAEAELKGLKEKGDKLHQKAQSHASRMLFLAFTSCAAQLGGMTYLIFGLYSWEVMESITYMVCKFLLENFNLFSCLLCCCG